MDKNDKDLLPPGMDPNKKAIGIRKVSAINEASTRSVMTVRGHTVVTNEKALPTILRCLDDPVPRVRWHAVHALICDKCKTGFSYLNDEVVERVRRVAKSDPSPKVRSQALHGIGIIEYADT